MSFLGCKVFFSRDKTVKLSNRERTARGYINHENPTPNQKITQENHRPEGKKAPEYLATGDRRVPNAEEAVWMRGHSNLLSMRCFCRTKRAFPCPSNIQGGFHRFFWILSTRELRGEINIRMLACCKTTTNNNNNNNNNNNKRANPHTKAPSVLTRPGDPYREGRKRTDNFARCLPYRTSRELGKKRGPCLLGAVWCRTTTPLSHSAGAAGVGWGEEGCRRERACWPLSAVLG